MIDYFIDPVLRGPTIGSALMCLAAAWIGVIVFLRKESLLGEALSHAAYPGVILGVIVLGWLPLNTDLWLTLIVLCGAFATAFLGLWTIHFLKTSVRVKSDAALCFVLSSFFGIALTLASRVQFTYTSLYRQAQVYLFGQAATMTDVHIVIYGFLSIIVISTITLFYKELHVLTLDREYAKTIGVAARSVDFIVFVLIVLALVIGIRSVGVVLMSAMLITPAVASRQFTHRMSQMLIISGIIGLFSGWLGNVFSVETSRYLIHIYPEHRLILPTGPMIVLVASFICLLSLLFAPERGLVLRWLRSTRFKQTCLLENLLKELWRRGEKEQMTLDQVAHYHRGSKRYLRQHFQRLINNGWVEATALDTYKLTHDGWVRASHIVRLHRLWEVYLSDYLGVGIEKVHRSAEEMEHILTPELEAQLTHLLRDPKEDPHHQPIPPSEKPYNGLY